MLLSTLNIERITFEMRAEVRVDLHANRSLLFHGFNNKNGMCILILSKTARTKFYENPFRGSRDITYGHN
jgi:hypothetical protein